VFPSIVMVPNVVPSISMAVILVPILGRSSNAVTPAQQTYSPGVTAGSDYQTGSTPFPPLTQIILKRRARRRQGGPPERERPEPSNVSRRRRRVLGFPPRQRP